MGLSLSILYNEYLILLSLIIIQSRLKETNGLKEGEKRKSHKNLRINQNGKL